MSGKIYILKRYLRANRANAVWNRRQPQTTPYESYLKSGNRLHTPENPLDGHTLYKGFLKGIRLQNQTCI